MDVIRITRAIASIYVDMYLILSVSQWATLWDVVVRCFGGAGGVFNIAVIVVCELIIIIVE